MDAKSFVLKILELLSDSPSEINVSEEVNANLTTITITPPASQMGRLIGKSGCNIKSLRSLLNIQSIMTGKQTLIKLIEPSN